MPEWLSKWLQDRRHLHCHNNPCQISPSAQTHSHRDPLAATTVVSTMYNSNGHLQNNPTTCNVNSRKVAVVSPRHVSPEAQPNQNYQDARIHILSTGSLDSGVDNLPFESGEDIPTFDEALSLPTFGSEQPNGGVETLLACTEQNLITMSTGGHTLTTMTHHEEIRAMPNHIGPKLEMNTMHLQPNPAPPTREAGTDSCNVLRSLLSNPRPQVSCKQEVSSSSPIASMTHPNHSGVENFSATDFQHIKSNSPST